MKETIVEALKEFIITGFKELGLGIIKSSYWICLTICLISLILYIAGQKKAGKYVSISFITYFILHCLKLAIEP